MYTIERPLDLTGCASTVTITFDYHMYFDGAPDGGTLELIVDDGTPATEWSRTGDQGQNWNLASVDLSAYAGSNVTLRFTFTTGTNTTFENDCALDNILIEGTPDVTNAGLRLADGTEAAGRILLTDSEGDAYWADPATLTIAQDTIPDDDWTRDIADGDMYPANIDDVIGLGTVNPDPTHVVQIHDDDSGATGTIIGIGSIEELIDNSSETTINNDFSPATDDTEDLGGPSLRWSAVYAANGTIQTSDARQKENVQPLEYGLNEVMALEPVRYQWRRDQIGTTTIPDSQKKQKIGFLAQDVENVVREVVYKYDWDVTDEAYPDRYEREEMPVMGMNYGEMVPVLVNAIKEQQAQIQQLEQRIAELEAAGAQE